VVRSLKIAGQGVGYEVGGLGEKQRGGVEVEGK